MNDCFLRALRREPVDRTPIWIMRQAGRYLPEYRALRAQVKDFMTLCKTPELACEVTLLPLQRFDLDAAIIFSDILTLPDAMDLGLSFVANEGPKFSSPVRDERDVVKLKKPDMDTDLGYVMEAICASKRALGGKVPLIGFSGSPWTLACYMIEGEGSKTFSVVRRWVYQAPEILHQLLKHMQQVVIDYLSAQVEAGVDAIMLFDTWGGLLAPEAYDTFSLSYMSGIVQALASNPKTQKTPIILFTKNGSQWLEKMAASGCHALSVDWTIDMGEAFQRVGNQVALQGNLDPAVLYGAPEKIQQAVQTILHQVNGAKGHIFNLGHGIYPDVPAEHVGVLVDAVHAYSQIGGSQ